MKKNTIIGALLSTVAVGIFVISSAFAPKDGHLTITNKTDSDIDEVHFDGSGDVMGDHGILHPGETLEVVFECAGADKDHHTKIHLVFEDGKAYDFEDEVCDGDFSWDIAEDGNHKD